VFQAGQVLAEGRDRVRNLRDTTVSLGDLPTTFQRVVGESSPGRATILKLIV